MSFLEKLKPVDSSFLSKLKPVRQGPFTFDDVEEAPGERESKIARYQQEAQQAEEESRKANSFMGKLGNFGKAFVGTIANSQVGLGQSIAKIMNVDSESTEGLQKAQEQNALTKANLLKRIREKEARGEDATRLKQEYNRLVKDPASKEVDRLLTDATTMPGTSKVVGQMGGTALDLLSAGTYGRATQAMTTGQRFVQGGSKVKGVATASGLPELGQLATQQAGGLFTRQGARNIGIGTGIGYTADVTQGLQGARGEDREGAKAFIPGAGTAIGFGIPFLSESAQSVRNVRNPDLRAQGLADKRYRELEKLNQQPLKNAVNKGNERGIDVRRVLAETDVLHGSVDKTGTITTKGDGGAVEQYTKMFIDGNEDLVSDLLKKEGASVSPDLVKLKLERAVMDAGIEGSALTQAKKKIAQELEGYALRAGDNGVIPVETLHRAKIDKYNNINFFTEGATKKYDKTIAKALKELVEENTKSVNVKMINEELSKHFAVIDYLNKLDNKKVSGGKLGKYFAETVGAIVGSHFGPVGAIVGAEAGGRLKGGLMARAFNGKTGRAVPQSKVITDAQKVLNEPSQALPQSNSLGNLNISQSTTRTPTNNSIPPSVLGTKKPSTELSPEKLFAPTDKSVQTSVDDLVSIKNTSQETIDETMRRFGEASKGNLSPRKPLSVVTLSDGKKLIVDGNGTFNTLKKNGYKGAIPTEEVKFNLDINPTDEQIKWAVKKHQEGSEVVKSFDAMIGDLSKDLSLKQLTPGDLTFKLKSVEGILKKRFQTNDKYVNDVVRDTVFAKPEDVPRIQAWIEAKGYKPFDTEVRPGMKNRFLAGKPGYKDANFQFEKDGIIYELQIMGENMYKTKEGFGHIIYDIFDKDYKYLQSTGKQDPAVKEAMDRLQKISDDIYDRAHELDVAGEQVVEVLSPAQKEEAVTNAQVLLKLLPDSMHKNINKLILATKPS